MNRIVCPSGSDTLAVMSSLKEMGEHEVLRRLIPLLGNHPDLVVGAGDDCAVVRLPGGGFDQVQTTDPVLQGVHFLPEHAPERVGNKAIGRVLSDIAAMGATPQWVLVNVVAPADLDYSWLEGLYRGMIALAERFGVSIAGGDLSQGNEIQIHVFGTGLLPAGTALLRSGAKVGDVVFVSGPLGGSRAGRHLDFIPRIEEGQFLRESGVVGAMMDISDGLATDLRHILQQSGVGADLDEERIPCNGTLEQALFDGEDFELLFTVSPGRVPFLMEQWRSRFGAEPFSIGTITGLQGDLRLCHPGRAPQVLDAKAFEHFRR